MEKDDFKEDKDIVANQVDLKPKDLQVVALQTINQILQDEIVPV